MTMEKARCCSAAKTLATGLVRKKEEDDRRERRNGDEKWGKIHSAMLSF